MKIVNTDNFGGDYPDEKFLCFSDDLPSLYLTKESAEEICKILNRGGEFSLRYYKVVENNYKLQPGFTS